MDGTKLKTLQKSENRSEWHKEQLRLEPLQYKGIPKNPWVYNNYSRQIVPGMPNVFGKLTKREQNGYLYQQKVNQANRYFNGNY